MADISMSLDETLELDTIIKQSSIAQNPINNITYSGPNTKDYNMKGIETHTSVFDPQQSGTYTIDINGQELLVEVTDTSTIPESVVLPESGDLNYFTGDTNNFSVTSASSPTQASVLESSSDENNIFSQIGLNRYPEPGFAWSIYINHKDIDDNTRLTYFGAEDINNNYTIYTRPTAATSFGIFKNGFDVLLTDTGSSDFSTDNWFEIEVEWYKNGEIVARLFDVNQSTGERVNQLYSDLTANDSDHLDNKGIGFHSGTPGTSGATTQWSDWRLTREL